MEENSMKGVQRVIARILLCVILASILSFFVLVVPVESIPQRDMIVDVTEPSETIIEEVTEVEEVPALKDEPLLFPEIVYEEFSYKSIVQAHYRVVNSCINDIETLVDSDMYTEEATAIMVQELSRLESIADNYLHDIEMLIRFDTEYYYASQVWQLLRLHGLSDAAVAGILGNLMWETGGGTLDIDPESYSSGGWYYGICQWSLYYNPDVKHANFEQQIDYLLSNIEEQFTTWGFCYKRNFGYEDFKTMDDPAQAALAFAKVYERCYSGSHGIRKTAAVKALAYFTNQ